MKVPTDFDFGQRELEANEELEAVAWAENNGWISRKLSFEGRRGAPDRMFAGHGELFICEFKKLSRLNTKRGGKSGGQSKEALRFEAVGVHVPTFYTASSCIDYLKHKMSKSLLV
jgi:hypothetical protein|tara:strand:- start:844 stop:1188 length:345 start_codon:yes stop_codon:yes gene_type:complete